MTEINWDVYYDVCRHFPTHPKTYEFYAALTERYNFVKKVNDENVNTSGVSIDSSGNFVFSNAFSYSPIASTSGWTIRSDGISLEKPTPANLDSAVDNNKTRHPDSAFRVTKDGSLQPVGIHILEVQQYLKQELAKKEWEYLVTGTLNLTDDSIGVQTQSAKLLNVISNIQNATGNLTDTEKEQVREACLVLGIL